MDRIAFIAGDTFIYWSSIILTLATATAICFFLATYLGKSGNGVGAARRGGRANLRRDMRTFPPLRSLIFRGRAD